MKKSALTIALFGVAAGAHAHVAGLSPADHTAEHAWLALALVPLLVSIQCLVRGRR